MKDMNYRCVSSARPLTDVSTVIHVICTASVDQQGDIFVRGERAQNHTGDTGVAMRIKARTLVSSFW